MNLPIFKRLFFCLLLMVSVTIHAQEGQNPLPPDTWPQLKTFTGIKIANKPGDMVQLVVLFDANCPHCAKLWSHIYGKDSRHQNITSLWAPVVYMKKDSAGKAAELLTANSRHALADNFEKFDFKERSGAAVPIDVSSNLRISLDRNTNTWQKLMAATPLLIYKTKEGTVLTQIGLPPEARLNAVLDSLAPNTLQGFGQ